MSNILEGPKQEYDVELQPEQEFLLTVCGPRRVRFHSLTGDRDYLSYGGKWISNKCNNGEFDYYFVIEIFNWQETVGDRVERDSQGEDRPIAKYNVSLSVVSPDQAGMENIKRALDCCGVTDEMTQCATDQGLRDEVLVEVLHAYGVTVSVWSDNGNNAKLLLRKARRQAQPAESLFGFVMDRPVNLIGTTGWEALQGDLTVGLTRMGT